MEAIRINLSQQEYQNLSSMTEIIRGQIKEYKSNSTGFLDWRYVCSTLYRYRFQFDMAIREQGFEVYEVESMIYMIKHLSQQKNNEMLYLKLVDSLQKFVIEPFGAFKEINDWFNSHKYLKSTFGNIDYKDLPEMYQDYLQEKYAQSKEIIPNDDNDFFPI